MSYFAKIVDLERENEENWARQSWTNTLIQKRSTYVVHRIVSELSFAKEISKVNNNTFDSLIEGVSKELYTKLQDEGGLVLQDVVTMEEQLREIIPLAKEYEIYYASHAHIDINWLWGLPETVNVAVDTFQTMLDLMEEDDEFIFSQSQAFLYQLIEEHKPKMFEEIKKRVKEGRWECTASTWVEGDKNMSNSESQSRQILYAKQYLNEKFGLAYDEIVVDFEPDTFGHINTIPELLTHTDVKYLYHSRGTNKTTAYIFEAPSGNQIIAYRDPKAYMMGANGRFLKNVVAYKEETSLNKILGVYGVCDHGGGPTKKDIEMIRDMMSWPLAPKIRFSTYKDYFEYLEDHKTKLPIVKDELNPIFTGCYTSQSRIKMANRYGENSLYDAEMFSVISEQKTNTAYDNKAYKEAWLNICTSQFHDILPGSGLAFTREYALGKFQETISYTLSMKKNAFEELTKAIDTSEYYVDNSAYYDTASGAGVGFNSEAFKISKSNRSFGETRIYHVFNSLPFEREEYVEIFVWNYEADIKKIKFINSAKEELEFVATPNPKIMFDGNMKNEQQASYWGHWYQTFRVKATIPAFGYETIILQQDESLENRFNNFLVVEDDIPHVEEKNEYILENDFVVATFDPDTLELVSYRDKNTNKELVGSNKASFQYVIEDTTRGMDSWIVGRSKSVTTVSNISDVEFVTQKGLTYLIYKAQINSSILKVKVTLYGTSKRLQYEVNAEWRELGVYQKEVPRLEYIFNTNSRASMYKYDTAFGVEERAPRSIEAAGIQFACGVYDDFNLFLTTDSKYGYVGDSSKIGVHLIRSSTDPDKYPEVGDHRFRFEIGPINDISNANLINQGKQFNHELDVQMGTIQNGTEPQQTSFLTTSNPNIIISSVKKGEKEGYILRCYEVNGTKDEVTIQWISTVKKAYLTNGLEEKQSELKVRDNAMTISFAPHEIKTIQIIV